MAAPSSSGSPCRRPGRRCGCRTWLTRDPEGPGTTDYRAVRVFSGRRTDERGIDGASIVARNDSSSCSGSRSGSFRARARFSGIERDGALEMRDRLGVLVPLSVRDGEHVDGVVVVRVFVAHEAKMGNRLVVLPAIDGERRRVQALVDGLRIRHSRGRLPLTDIQVEPNPFVQFLLFRILPQHRFQNGVEA